MTTPTATPTPTQEILGFTDVPSAPNTASGVAPARPSEGGWQALVVLAAGLLAAIFMLTPRRRRSKD